MISGRATKFPLLACLLTWAGLADARDLEPSCAFARALCGYVDAAGKVAIPPAFDSARRFHKGHAVVKLGGQYGIIDETGAFTAPAEYQGATVLPGGELLLYRDGISRLLNPSGQLIAEAAAQVIRPLDADHVLLGQDIEYFDAERFDLIDFVTGGTWRIRTLSTGAETAPVAAKIDLISEDPGFPFWQEINGEYFLTAPDGRRLTGGLSYGGGFARGLIVAAKDGRWGFIDRQGRTKIDFQFDWVSWFGNDEWTTFRVGPHDKAKYGYIDQTGKIVIPARFDEAFPFRGDHAEVTLNGARIIIDRSGQRAGPCRRSPLARQIDGGFQLLRPEGTPLTDDIYNYAQPGCGAPSLVELRDGRSGFVTETGDLLGGKTYHEAFPFNDGVALVWTDPDHVAIIDEAGAFILKPVVKRAWITSNLTTTTIHRGDEEITLTRRLAKQLARDASLIAEPPPPMVTVACPADGVDITEADGTITYVDASGQPFIEGAFDFATCFYGRDRAWVAVRDRQEWCEIDKLGRIDTATCTCGQPILAIEDAGGEPESVDGPDCYKRGLKTVGSFASTQP